MRQGRLVGSFGWHNLFAFTEREKKTFDLKEKTSDLLRSSRSTQARSMDLLIERTTAVLQIRRLEIRCTGRGWGRQAPNRMLRRRRFAPAKLA